MRENLIASSEILQQEMAAHADRIVKAGHPKLHRPALAVADTDHPDLDSFVKYMMDTMLEASGVGLAAPQVGVGLRILTYWIPPERAKQDKDSVAIAPRCLINPHLEILSDETEDGVEGCLSFPGMYGAVPRYRHILCRADLPGGGKWEAECHGFEARILQHETDHLDGIMFVERMKDLSKFGYIDELKAAQLG